MSGDTERGPTPHRTCPRAEYRDTEALQGCPGPAVHGKSAWHQERGWDLVTSSEEAGDLTASSRGGGGLLHMGVGLTAHGVGFLKISLQSTVRVLSYTE